MTNECLVQLLVSQSEKLEICDLYIDKYYSQVLPQMKQLSLRIKEVEREKDRIAKLNVTLKKEN